MSKIWTIDEVSTKDPKSKRETMSVGFVEEKI